MGADISFLPADFEEIDIFSSNSNDAITTQPVTLTEWIDFLYKNINESSAEWPFVHEEEYAGITNKILNTLRSEINKTTRITQPDIEHTFPNQAEKVMVILLTYEYLLNIRFDKTFQVFLGSKDPLYRKTQEISTYKENLPDSIAEEERQTIIDKMREEWSITQDMADSMFNAVYTTGKRGYKKIHSRQKTTAPVITTEHLKFLKQIKTMPKKPQVAPQTVKVESLILEDIETSKSLRGRKSKSVENDYPKIKIEIRGPRFDNTVPETPFGPDGEIIDVELIGLTLDECACWKKAVISYEMIPMPEKLENLFEFFKTNTPEIIERNQIETKEQLLSVLRLLFRKDFVFLQ